jgi:hypothetical protein
MAVGLMLAAAALLSACSGQNTAAPATQTTAPVSSVVSNTPASSKTTAAATVAPHPKSSKQAPASAPPLQGKNESAGDSVNCSANGGGKVGPAGGKQVDLIADATPAGTVGCTEAFNVISDYYRDAPTKSEGTGHYLVVQGWTCMADTGASGTGMIGCDKDGRSFHTGQS